MTFKIESASMSSPIIKAYPVLKDFNFKQISNEEYEGEIEISSIDELDKLIKGVNYPLIIGSKWFQNRNANIQSNVIEIYDGYIE